MQTYIVEMKPLGDSTIEDIGATLPTDMKWEVAAPTGEYQNLRVTIDNDQMESFANWLNVEVDQLAEYEEKES